MLAELVYNPQNKLRFCIRSRLGVSFSTRVQEYQPLQWVESYARTNVLRLPSNVECFESLDSLAERIRSFIHCYFDSDPVFESVSVLYALHTWVYERFQAVPYLRMLGLWGNGKTRGTETVGAVCYRPLMIAGAATPASMFRMIEAVGGTVLFDEADFSNSQVGSDVMKVFNCGNQKSLSVTRMDKDADGQFVPKLHQVFGPKILNGRKRFGDEATESRCLTYTPNATVRPDIPRQLPPEFEAEACSIRNRALDWRFKVLDTFAIQNIHIPELRARTNQIMLPLLSITEHMGAASRERYKKDLLEFGISRDEKAREIGRVSMDAKLVDAFVNWESGPSPTCKDLQQRVLEDEREGDPNLLKWFNDRWVGKKLREMGFETPHTNRGSVPRIEPSRLKELCSRYGVGIVTPSSCEGSPAGGKG